MKATGFNIAFKMALMPLIIVGLALAATPAWPWRSFCFVPAPLPAVASEISQVEIENFTVVGVILPVKTAGNEARPVYELRDDEGNAYKLIGPKAILDQLLAVKGYENKKFCISGQLKKSVKDSKKGILMSGFEIYAPPAPVAPLSAPPAASSAENALIKEAPAVPTTATVEAGIK